MSKEFTQPAFPVPGLQHDEDFNGMSLRDYFAAMALPALLQPAYSDLGTNFFTAADADGRANLAYAVADAMPAARSA